MASTDELETGEIQASSPSVFPKPVLVLMVNSGAFSVSGGVSETFTPWSPTRDVINEAQDKNNVPENVPFPHVVF